MIKHYGTQFANHISQCQMCQEVPKAAVNTDIFIGKSSKFLSMLEFHVNNIFIHNVKVYDYFALICKKILQNPSVTSLSICIVSIQIFDRRNSRTMFKHYSVLNFLMKSLFNRILLCSMYYLMYLSFCSSACTWLQ